MLPDTAEKSNPIGASLLRRVSPPDSRKKRLFYYDSQVRPQGTQCSTSASRSVGSKLDWSPYVLFRSGHRPFDGFGYLFNHY